jgi:2-polyprenyl-3-methyl-5-hydroxy-6-metoxy-1,4-benzoquinol methylase
LGADDPMWAVLTHDDHRGGLWDEEAFLQTGRKVVGGLLDSVAHAGLTVPHGPVLDFGCGVGRLTLALCEHFDEVHGVDIASTMIDEARRLAARQRKEPIYHLNDRPDLGLFHDATFGLVVSLIVLQHMPPDRATDFIGEFMRVLRPGGVAVFQVPERHRQPDRLLDPRRLSPSVRNALIRLGGRIRRRPVMEMHPLPSATVEAAVRGAGGSIVVVTPDELAGDLCESVTYIVVRDPRDA